MDNKLNRSMTAIDHIRDFDKELVKKLVPELQAAPLGRAGPPETTSSKQRRELPAPLTTPWDAQHMAELVFLSEVQVF